MQVIKVNNAVKILKPGRVPQYARETVKGLLPITKAQYNDLLRVGR